MESYEKFNKLIELMGKDAVITEILNYFPSSDINKFVDSVANDNDIMIDEESDDIIIDEESYLDNMMDTIDQWFEDSCNEEMYYDEESRMEELKAMANHSNSDMVDSCVEYLLDMYSKAEDYRDKIEEKLAELASNEL